LFDKLSGSSSLRESIINGNTEDEIRKTWDNELIEYKKLRKKYLIYKNH
jgi:uncharacterized protein YbbC (DUF1343 family)